MSLFQWKPTSAIVAEEVEMKFGPWTAYVAKDLGLHFFDKENKNKWTALLLWYEHADYSLGMRKLYATKEEAVKVIEDKIKSDSLAIVEASKMIMP